MPLHLFTSNELEVLFDYFYENSILEERDPFSFKHVIVNNYSVSRWIHLKIAKRQGISSNIKFYLPAQFIWKFICTIFDLTLPDYALSRDIIFWQIYKELPGLLDDKDFIDLKEYINKEVDIDEIRLYNISKIITNLFDEYTIYRYDWLIEWKNRINQIESINDKTIRWQAKLWTKLSSLEHRNVRIELLEKFINYLKDETNLGSIKDKLTNIKTLDIFGIYLIPPIFLDLLLELSNILEINFYLLNPSPVYWFDLLSYDEYIKKEHEISKKESIENFQSLHYEKGNSILISNGKVLRDLMIRIYNKNLTLVEKKKYILDKNNTLLSIVKNDILLAEYVDNEGLDDKDFDSDRSIQMHVCHSKRREIEVLHDVLLDLFNNDKELTPGDILVMAPNINEYAEIIDAVFQAYDDNRFIPYTIADKSEIITNPIVKSFFKVLSLDKSRFLASDIIGLLEINAIRNKLELNEENFKRLIYIIHESGIRWGIDSKHREEEISFGFHENSWEYGLERVLLGYCFPYEDKKILDKNYPYPKISINDTDILANFLYFFDSLVFIRNILKEKYSIPCWIDFIQNYILTLYIPDDEREKSIIEIIIEVLNSIKKIVHTVNIDKKVSIDTIKEIIKDKLFEYDRTGQFFDGRVTFANIGTINFIPYKCVYLLGMNEGEFPRNDVINSFDLITRYPREGDRNRRLIDKQFFLNCLLSAKKYFIISYIGNDTRDNSKKMPSMLVMELLDYLDRRFQDKKISEKIIIEHNIQPFSKEYFINGNKKFTYKHEWMPQSNNNKCFYDVSIINNNIDKISVEQLINFFYNPHRFFIQNQLGIYFYKPKNLIQDEEISEIPEKKLNLLELTILEFIINELSNEKNINLTNIVHEKVKKFIIQNNFYIQDYDYSHILEKLDIILSTLNPVSFYKKEFNLKLDSINIFGSLYFNNDDLVLFSLKKINKAYDYLELWIKHLIANLILDKTYRSKIYSIEYNKYKNEYLIKSYYLNRLKRDETEHYINSLVNIFLTGIKRPIDFFIELSYNFANSLRKQNTNQKGENQDQFYIDTYRLNSILSDPYIKKFYQGLDSIITQEFKELSIKVFEPILDNIKEN